MNSSESGENKVELDTRADESLEVGMGILCLVVQACL